MWRTIKMKKILLMVLAVLLFSCEDNTAEEDYSLKLWVNGEEVNVESDFKQVTTYTESVEYAGYDSTVTFLKKIFVIHLQKDAGRIEADKEHYAIVFTDWEGDLSNGLPIDGGAYQWPSVCSACPRACMHGAPSKWIRMEVNGTDDYSVSGTGHLDEIINNTISGDAEGTFWSPITETYVSGKIKFNNLKVETNKENTPYDNYGGR
jgi:hypothetical protein